MKGIKMKKRDFYDKQKCHLLLSFVEKLAEESCDYGDNCPDSGRTHDMCFPCKANKLLKEDI